MTSGKFTIDAVTLADALALLTVTAERKTTIPVLAYVLVESGEGQVKLSATDLDCAVTTTVAATIEQPFAACVPLRDVHEVVRLMGGAITIELKGATAWAVAGSAKHRFPTLPPTEFRAITPAADIIATLNGPLLSTMITAAMIAAEINPDGEDKWKALEVGAGDGELSITGGNGARIASASTPCPATFYALLPLRSATILAGFAAGSDEVTLALSPNLLTARSANGEASLKLSATKWPNWRMLVAPTYAHEVAVDSEAFIPALKRSLLTCNDSKVARVDFTLTATNMAVTAQGRDRGSREDLTIACSSLNGDELAFGVNGTQLLDFFKVCKGGAVWRIPANSPAQMLVPATPLPFNFRYIQATMKARVGTA